MYRPFQVACPIHVKRENQTDQKNAVPNDVSDLIGQFDYSVLCSWDKQAEIDRITMEPIVEKGPLYWHSHV